MAISSCVEQRTRATGDPSCPRILADAANPNWPAAASPQISIAVSPQDANASRSVCKDHINVQAEAEQNHIIKPTKSQRHRAPRDPRAKRMTAIAATKTTMPMPARIQASSSLNPNPSSTRKPHASSRTNAAATETPAAPAAVGGRYGRGGRLKDPSLEELKRISPTAASRTSFPRYRSRASSPRCVQTARALRDRRRWPEPSMARHQAGRQAHRQSRY